MYLILYDLEFYQPGIYLSFYLILQTSPPTTIEYLAETIVKQD